MSVPSPPSLADRLGRRVSARRGRAAPGPKARQSAAHSGRARQDLGLWARDALEVRANKTYLSRLQDSPSRGSICVSVSSHCSVLRDWRCLFIHPPIHPFNQSVSGENRTICGTPNFIAPEILASDSAYSDAVDVWSLGCILYCLLIGRAPFEGRKVRSADHVCGADPSDD